MNVTPLLISEIAEVLLKASSPSNEVQQYVMRAIEELSKQPDFATALGFILVSPSVTTVDVRQRAGLLLKASLSRGSIQYNPLELREVGVKAIADSDASIRKTGGSIITTLVTTSPHLPCSDVLRLLATLMMDPSPVVSHGAFDAIMKITEDVVEMWRTKSVQKFECGADTESRIMIDDFINYSSSEFVPLILTLTDTNKRISLLNAFALNFLFFPNHPLDKHLGSYFQTLGELAAKETNPDTVSKVCKGLVYIGQHHPDMYSGALGAVIEFMLRVSKSPEYNVRLDSLQFWPVVITNAEWVPQLQPHLPQLLPILLDNMIYSQEDFLNMDEGLLAEDDARVPDRAEDMAPRFHKETGENSDECLEDEDEDEASISTWGGEWTVRKAAASALDHIATAYRDSILPTILPLIESRLRDEAWEIQECSLLALGAIGHGCMQGLSPHLPAIMQLLVNISKSRKPLLRSISCWTISRFAAWISFDTHRPTALPLALSVILVRMLDQNKRVQEAAVSAFVSLAEEVGIYLEEYLGDILKTLTAALNYYQSKNLLILLDAIACMFETLSAEVMSAPNVIEALVPTIVRAFGQVSFEVEKQLSVSLFECLTAILTNVGSSAGLECLETVLRRCASVISDNVNAYKRITGSLATEDRPNSDVLACALDLLCGLLDGLSSAASNMVAQLNFIPSLCQLIHQFEHESKLPLVRNYYSNSVRQCAFALLGDVAKTCSVFLTDDLVSPIIPTVVAYVTIGPMSVSNNASWALGELVMRKSLQSVEPHTDMICVALMTNLKRFEGGTRPIVRQNAAIALGRLGLVASQRLVASGAFAEMFEAWCVSMKKLRLDDEKITAVKGFMLCVEQAPQVGLTRERLVLLFELIASMLPPPAAIEIATKNIILMYRQILGEADWTAMWSSFPIELQYRMNHAFSLGMTNAHPQPHVTSG
jgi:transportin-1